MPTCIFILSRFTLRVDNVLFRAHDTRIYHSFASTPPLVVRETRGWEAPYERIKRVCYTFRSVYAHLMPLPPTRYSTLLSYQALPRRDDLMPLTDPNFICKTLSEMPREVSQDAGAGTGWRGLGNAVQIATLQS
jgi:type 2A phosphatase activator TIP41